MRRYRGRYRPRARRRGRRLARPLSSKGAGGPLPSSVLLIEGGYGKLGARRRVRRPGSLVPEPLGSRPAEQIDPLLHELGQTAGMVRIQAVGRGLGSRVAIGLEPRFVPGQHVLDLREGKPAGHDPVPAAARAESWPTLEGHDGCGNQSVVRAGPFVPYEIRAPRIT